MFGVAYAGGYARVFSRAGLKSALRQLWCIVPLLAFYGFISFHFGLLCLHLFSYLPKRGGLWPGLSVAFAEVASLMRGELVASDKFDSQLQGHQIPQESQSLMFKKSEKIHLRKSAYAIIIIHGYAKCLRRLRNHENFQVLRLRALFAVPFSS